MSPTPPPASASTTSDLANNLTSALGAADSTATDRIQNLSFVHQARATQLARTAASVTARYGAGSAQAISAQQAVTDAKTIAARVDVVRQQVATPAPQVAATGWALHGRVFDVQLQPAAAHTVYLVDAQNAYQNNYGFSYTDATGYFSITSTDARIQTPRSTARKAPGTTSAAAPPPPSSPELFVAIVSPAAQPVYLATAAFQPIIGAATYENIVLPGGEAAIGDPPEVIRRIAIPPTDPTAN